MNKVHRKQRNKGEGVKDWPKKRNIIYGRPLWHILPKNYIIFYRNNAINSPFQSEVRFLIYKVSKAKKRNVLGMSTTRHQHRHQHRPSAQSKQTPKDASASRASEVRRLAFDFQNVLEWVVFIASLKMLLSSLKMLLSHYFSDC